MTGLGLPGEAQRRIYLAMEARPPVCGGAGAVAKAAGAGENTVRAGLRDPGDPDSVAEAEALGQGRSRRPGGGRKPASVEHPGLVQLVLGLEFWKGKGVSCFRFDMINLISKPEGWPSDDTDGRHFFADGPHVHEFIRDLCVRSGIDEAMTVGEMNGHVATGPRAESSLEHSCRYTNPANHELAMIFSFNHLKVDYADNYKWELAKVEVAELRRIFALYQERMQAGGGWMGLFWSNHDQPRPNSRFCGTSSHWFESSTLLPTCTFFMRGTPFIYQGEELGQTITDYTSIDDYRDVESHNYYRILQEQGATSEEAFYVVHVRSRDDGRYPMAWDASGGGGFTTGSAWLALPANHVRINAETEEADPHSVLSYFKRLIALRKELPVVQAGLIRFVEVPDDKVIAYERSLDGTTLLVQCNFSGDDVPMIGVEGSKTLIGNYDDAPAGFLRPWEALVSRRDER